MPQSLTCNDNTVPVATSLLVYIRVAVEVIPRGPPQARGLARGTYTASSDLSLGVGNAALGLLAAKAGLSAVFPASALAELCAAVIAMRLLRAPSRSDDAIGLRGLQGDSIFRRASVRILSNKIEGTDRR